MWVTLLRRWFIMGSYFCLSFNLVVFCYYFVHISGTSTAHKSILGAARYILGHGIEAWREVRPNREGHRSRVAGGGAARTVRATAATAVGPRGVRAVRRESLFKVIKYKETTEMTETIKNQIRLVVYLPNATLRRKPKMIPWSIRTFGQ